jgi:hypothetical protein
MLVEDKLMLDIITTARTELIRIDQRDYKLGRRQIKGTSQRFKNAYNNNTIEDKQKQT